MSVAVPIDPFQKAIDKVYSRIHKWNKWKNNRNLITFVSGCVLPSDKEKFLKLFDMVFTMSQLPELPEMINHYGIVTPAGLMGNENIQVEQEFTDNSPQLGGFRINKAQIPSSSTLVEKKPEDIKEFWNIEPKYGSNVEAYIPIQNGCDKFCTFLAVSKRRGFKISNSTLSASVIS